MQNNGHDPADQDARILPFRHRRSDERGAAGPPGGGDPIDGLDRYERGEEADDYRHRMLVNLAAVLLVGGLIGAGLWIANTMAEMRRNQDCALQGRRNCAPVEVTRQRW